MIFLQFFENFDKNHKRDIGNSGEEIGPGAQNEKRANRG